MAFMIVEYDLCSPGRNYDELYEAIESYHVNAPITESTWLIKTAETCVQVRNRLMAHMDKNDRLFVAPLTGSAAWNNVLCNSASLKRTLEGR